jgi:ribosomal protein S30
MAKGKIKSNKPRAEAGKVLSDTQKLIQVEKEMALPRVVNSLRHKAHR